MTRKTESISGPTALVPDARWMATAVALVAAAMGLLMLWSPVAHAADAHHACAIVLGLDPSEAPYQDCVRNLEQHVRIADPPARVAKGESTEEQAGLACADIGLEPGSLAAARCTADLNQTLSGQEQIYR